MQVFWADAVERSRTERLGRAKASQIRRSITQEQWTLTAAAKQAAEAFMKPLDRPEDLLDSDESSHLSLTDPSVLLEEPSLDCSHFLYSVGQQVDATTKTTAKFNNATVLNVHPSQGIRVGFRLYHDSGPFTECRGGKSAQGQKASAYAKRAYQTNGETPSVRYFGLSQQYDCWVPVENVVALASRATDLLDLMDNALREEVMGSLSRLELRRDREMSGDKSGTLAMDRAMRAYQEKDHGALHYYASPSKTRYNAWKKMLSPAIPPLVAPRDEEETAGQQQLNKTPSLNTNSAIIEQDEEEQEEEREEEGKELIAGSSLIETKFIPSLNYTGNVPGYSYELQARGLGYYTKPYQLDNTNKKGLREQRALQMRDLRRELEVCQQLAMDDTHDTHDTQNNNNNDDDDDGARDSAARTATRRMTAIKERECDIRQQLAMCMRLEVEAMWLEEKIARPPLEDEHQTGPRGQEPLLIIRQAVAVLRGILLINPEHASARLNSIEMIGMLPINIRSEMYGGSFIFDSVYLANPNVFPPFVQKRVSNGVTVVLVAIVKQI